MRQFLRNLMFGDWLLKFFSLALAVLTWLAVSFSLRQKPVEVPGKPDLLDQPYTDVPVAVVSSSTNVHGIRVSPSELDVTVRGEKQVIQQLERQHIRVQVDLSDQAVTNGAKKAVDVVLPAGVTRVRVVPEEVEIILPATVEPKKDAP